MEEERYTDRGFPLQINLNARYGWAEEDGIYGDEKIWSNHSSSVGVTQTKEPTPLIVRTYRTAPTHEQVFEDAARDGCRPATIEEVCGLLDQKRNELLPDPKHNIACIGSTYCNVGKTQKNTAVFFISKEGKLARWSVDPKGMWRMIMEGSKLQLSFVLVWLGEGAEQKLPERRPIALPATFPQLAT